MKNYGIDFAQVAIKVHHHVIGMNDGVPMYAPEISHVTTEWIGDSMFTILPLQGIQDAMKANHYPVQMPVSDWSLLRPGMLVFVGGFTLELMAIDKQYSSVVVGIFQRIA